MNDKQRFATSCCSGSVPFDTAALFQQLVEERTEGASAG